MLQSTIYKPKQAGSKKLVMIVVVPVCGFLVSLACSIQSDAFTSTLFFSLPQRAVTSLRHITSSAFLSFQWKQTIGKRKRMRICVPKKWRKWGSKIGYTQTSFYFNHAHACFCMVAIGYTVKDMLRFTRSTSYIFMTSLGISTLFHNLPPLLGGEYHCFHAMSFLEEGLITISLTKRINTWQYYRNHQ